jgi:hypothetical protein
MRDKLILIVAFIFLTAESKTEQKCMSAVKISGEK